MNFAFIIKSLRNLSWPRHHRNQRHLLGSRGERAAATFLRRRGHRILTRNYRCRAGEIDLICSHGDTLVFIEVKTRSSDRAEDPQETLHGAQRKRIENAARFYLLQCAAQDRPCRFDVVTVIWPEKGSPRIEHFEDVFQPRRR